MSKSSNPKESIVFTVKAQREDGSVITLGQYGDAVTALVREEAAYGTFEFVGVWTVQS